MPYSDTTDLPEDIKEVLPEHARHIFKEAFNSAYEDYKDPEKRRTEGTNEEIAFKVAWSAVKNMYEKGNDGMWHRKAE